MNNLFTAGSVGSVQVMVAMLLLHVVVAIADGVRRSTADTLERD